ncbi:hypothetical protein [Treponema sp.]|uniref:hypothetical protein n=1 Tax=Treponema sp. TaxID=166 RepID=UPI003F0175D2
MLYVFFNDIDKNQCARQVLSELNRTDVKVIPAGKSLWKYKNKISRFVLHLGFFLNIPFNFNFEKLFLEKISEIKVNDSILVFGGGFGISPSISFAFLKLCKAERRFLWLWDSVHNKAEKRFLKYFKKHYEVYTFDYNDSQKYKLNYKNTVGYLPELKQEPKKDGKQLKDIYFVGLDRGRYEILNTLYEDFSKLGLICDFNVLKDEKSPKKEKMLKFINGRIGSLENSRRIYNSRAVLDIPVNGQNGLTQRVLEALFFGRKVITNNESIKNEVFYRPENVFVLNDKNLEDIKMFLSKPFVKNNLSQYTINNWITEFTQQTAELCSTI